MSRVGGSPIKIPSGVTLSLVDGVVSAKGAKGELSKALPPMVELNIGDEEATVTPLGKSIKARLANMVISSRFLGAVGAGVGSIGTGIVFPVAGSSITSW